jgi:hypothetical protein
MKKHTLALTIVTLTAVFLIGGSRPAFAFDNVAGDGARLSSSFGDIIVDRRVGKLRAFLKNYDSPLAKDAHVFVREADRHDLDWRLVVAIAGAESTFGKHIPQGSYNAWGWGIPTGAQSGLGFKNWEQGIATVSEGLAKNYYGKGAKTLYEVGWIYAANGISWGNSVGFFLDKIDEFIPVDSDYLDVTI